MSERLYYVYVIELTYERVELAQAVYVGSSAHRPSERLRDHLRGKGFAYAGVVRRRGKRLRPDLARGMGPYPTRQEAKDAEKRLRRRLEKQGFRVYGACKRSESKRCVL